MIQDLAGSLSSRPVHYLVNTVHRGDHTFGNASFPGGVKIVASAQAAAAMGSLDHERRSSRAIRPPLLPGPQRCGGP